MAKTHGVPRLQISPQTGWQSFVIQGRPSPPYIEQGIRTFLDLIDFELSAARKVSKVCSEKWQNFPFPEKIDRSEIRSDNYVSGRFRFSLSEDKILNLLTGDNLYPDHFVFIRELLQNAIDTVRHRVFIERNDKSKIEPRPITVSYFKDPEGYYWLREDDCGMGMSQDIIEKYLLNKGNSYYQSDEFKLQKIEIRAKAGDDFVPISRFGIGLLSCFMACDEIEISTCYFNIEKGESTEKTRLSIEGRAGYWVIRSDKKHHVADKMPAEGGWEKGYRSEPGTSIACRINTAKEVRGLHIERQIDRFLLAPEIPVDFQGKLLGGDREEMAMKPWCEQSRTSLPGDFLQKCSEFLETEVAGIDIEIRPIDLSKKSADGNLTGQLVLVMPHITMKNPSSKFSLGDHFQLRSEEKNVIIVCEKTMKGPDGNQIKSEILHDISHLTTSIRVPEKFLEGAAGHTQFLWPRVSHNGIVVQDNEQLLQFHLPIFDRFTHFLNRQSTYYLSTGLYCFRDVLLPELQVSRSSIKYFTPEIIGHVLYATREMNEYSVDDFPTFSYLPDLEGKQRHSQRICTIQMYETVGLYQKDKDYWHQLPCLLLKDGMITIEQALELAKTGPIAFQTMNFQNLWYSNLIKYILLKNLVILYKPDQDGYYLEGRQPDHPIEIPGKCKIIPTHAVHGER